jgi:hypothetical protein
MRKNEKKRKVNTSSAPVKNTRSSGDGKRSRSSNTNLGWAAEVPRGIEPNVRRRREQRRRAAAQDLERQHATEKSENDEARSRRRKRLEQRGADPAELRRRK